MWKSINISIVRNIPKDFYSLFTFSFLLCFFFYLLQTYRRNEEEKIDMDQICPTTCWCFPIMRRIEKNKSEKRIKKKELKMDFCGWTLSSYASHMLNIFLLAFFLYLFRTNVSWSLQNEQKKSSIKWYAMQRNFVQI